MHVRTGMDRAKPGVQKALDACRVAKERYDLEYIWIDTCCIKKESSAELSEAINSMFAWYKKSEVCLAFLNDLSPKQDDEAFCQSQWFTRAWTLQELLAPGTLEFFDNAWGFAGTKIDRQQLIANLTGIPEEALSSNDHFHKYKVDQKMTWAANRVATRREDIAYSLLGLLDVNMPLLYGENDKAFKRLQEEIVQHAIDLRSLCWGLGLASSALLADEPAQFYGVTIDSHPAVEMFTWNNIGLELRRLLNRCGVDLYCTFVHQRKYGEYIAIIIRQENWFKQIFYYKVRMTVINRAFLGQSLSRMSTFTILRENKSQKLMAARPASGLS